MENKMVGKVALGATVVTLAAGAIATREALKSKKNRTKLRKGAEKAMKGMEKVRMALEEGKDRYQAYQHRIGLGKKTILKAGRKIKKGVK